MTELFDEYLQGEEPLTYDFFNTLYWRTSLGRSHQPHQPETGDRGFLGIIKGLVNKIGFGIGGGENSGIRCSFYDNDDNKLDNQVLFGFDPADWDKREESFVLIDNSEFSKLLHTTLEKYSVLQKKRWSSHPEIKEVEEKEIGVIKNLLNINFAS
jgi:hypothetical protein